MTSVKIGDLVEVRSIRTVIHLEDAGHARHAAEIASGFVPTPDVVSVIQVVYQRLAARQGEGLFVQGAYGSGKSHLLAYLGLSMRDAGAREALAGDRALEGLVAAVSPGSWLVAALPLVDHPARVGLEELVAGAIGRAFRGRGLPEPALPGEDRAVWVRDVQEALAAGGLAGILLLIDELSEFLRAKPTAPAYAEDIRYLQFLGERGAELPAVIAVGLQEAVDETGPIAPEAMAKIKDRYPHRFFLTAAHVGELVRRRLLVQKPGSRPQIESIHRRLRACLPHWTVDLERFQGLYPVHPATLLFLEQLRPLFSQHRGVVDFLVTRLAGSAERGIEPFLERPAGTLLTVDVIFDHFRDRIRERIETAPLVDEVMGWWEENLPTVVPVEEERDLAARALRVLALASLMPYEYPVTPTRMAEVLVVTVTDLEPSINDHMVADVLEKMATHGAYVTREDAPGGDPLAATYTLKRGANAALVLRARIREVAAGLTGRPEEILRAIPQAVDGSHLPVATLAVAGRTRRTVPWQHTMREGWVRYADPEEPGAEERDAMAREFATSETDFFFYLVPPVLAGSRSGSVSGDGAGAGAGAGVGDGAGTGQSPGKSGDPGGAGAGASGGMTRARLPAGLAELPVIAWYPQPLTDLDFLTGARARQVLARKLEADESPPMAEVKRTLAALIEEDRRHLTELVAAAYEKGSLVGPAGGVAVGLASGLPTFDQVLARSVSALLELRFPGHFHVAPANVTLGRARLGELLEGFLRSGSSIPASQLAAPVRTLVEGYLKTLGLAHRGPQGWQLLVDLGRADAAAAILERVGETPVNVEELYWQFRKSSLGLMRDGFELVLACLIFSGHLVPLSQGRKVPPGRITAGSFDRISQVLRETPLPLEALGDLVDLPLIPARLQSQPPGVTLEKQLWDEILSLKSRGVVNLAGASGRMKHALSEGFLEHLDLDEASAALDAFVAVLTSVKVSATPREGLTELHRILREQGLIERLRALRPLIRFLDEHAVAYLTMAGWLGQPDLEVPESPEHASLALKLGALRRNRDDPATCLDRDAFRTFQQDFEVFQEEYRAAYVADHQGRRSASGLAPWLRIRGSAPMRVLDALCRSPLAVAPPALAKLRSCLELASRAVCDQLSPFVLKTRATCTCGHRLGQTLPLPPVVELNALLEKAMGQVLQDLAAAPRARELERARSRLEQSGALQEAALLSDLRELRAGAPDLPERLGRLVQGPLEGSLERLSRLQHAPERELTALIDRLSGKILTRAQVLQAVTQWLGEDVGEASFVRILAPAGTTPPSPAGVGARSEPPGGGLVPADATPFRSSPEDPRPAAGSSGPAAPGGGGRSGASADPGPDAPGDPGDGAGEAGDDPWSPESLRRALLAHWTGCHGLEPGEVARLAGLEPVWAERWPDRVARGRRVLESASPAELDEALEPLDHGAISARLLDRLTRGAGPTRLLAALEAETLFPSLARRLAGLCLKALAASPRELLRRGTSEEEAGRGCEGGAPGEGSPDARPVGRGERSPGPSPARRPGVQPFHDLVRLALELAGRLEGFATGPGRPVSSFPGWEDRFARLAPIPAQRSRLEETAVELGMEAEVEATGLAAAAGRRLAAEAEAFEPVYRETLPTAFEEGGGPVWPHRVLDRLFPRLRRHHRGAIIQLVVIDAMRWDFHALLAERYLSRPGTPLRYLETRTVWALAPTVTEVNMRALLTGEAPDARIFEGGASGEVPRHREAPGRSWSPRADEGLALTRVDTLDELLHASGLPLARLFDAALLPIVNRLAALVDRLEPGTLLVLTADHGFIENPAHRPHGPAARYRHGGLDPFEVLVPLSVHQRV